MIGLLSILGAFLVLGAYFMLATERWSQREWPYHVTSLVSAVILTYVAVSLKSPGYLLLNVAWGVISLYTLAKIRRRHMLP